MTLTKEGLADYFAPFPSPALDSTGVCSGRSVKEITEYFDKLSNPSSPCSEIVTEMKHKNGSRNFMTMYPKNISSNCVTNQTRSITGCNTTVPKDVILHSIWKDSIINSSLRSRQSVHTADIKRTKIMDSVKSTLKSTVVACVMTLQYFI